MSRLKCPDKPYIYIAFAVCINKVLMLLYIIIIIIIIIHCSVVGFHTGMAAYDSIGCMSWNTSLKSVCQNKVSVQISSDISSVF